MLKGCKNASSATAEWNSRTCLTRTSNVRDSSARSEPSARTGEQSSARLALSSSTTIRTFQRTEGRSSADTYNHTRDVYQEYKVNTSKFPTEGAIDNLLRKANKQADHVVLWVESDISNARLAHAIHDRLQRDGNKIKEIIVVKDGKDAVYDLRQIKSDGFKIEPTDFK